MNATTLTKWQPYLSYKDSGVEWLGEIPEHWEVKRLKYVTRINQDVLSENTNSDYVLRYMDISNVDSNGLILNSQEMRFENAPSRARRMVKHGDTIISTVRTYLRAIAFINKPPGNLIVSTGFAVIRPKPELHPKFLWRIVQSSDFVDAVVSYSEGVSYPAINSSVLANFMVWFPSINEQRAIANFLDRKTAESDALIAKKELLIELLQEKRTALISHAVTKGLDATMEMRDSGVKWLGEIPAHWEIRKLKYVADAPLQYGANESAELTNPDLPRYIRITDINEDGSLRDDTFRSLPEHIAKPYLLKHGDVLFARSGATVGKTSMYHESWGTACYAGYLIRLRVKLSLTLPEYLFYFTSSSSYQNWLDSIFIQSTIQNVSAEKYANLVITIPPIAEQRNIIIYLDHETTKIDALITQIREGIDKLKEYRTALISAAATGKIDVRDYQSGE